MTRPRIVIVVAVARNGVIGRDGTLPWRLPDDLKRFKALTLGKPCVMGRKTAASLGRPLPGRTNIVLTRTGHRLPEGFVRAASPAEALALAGPAAEVMIIGGAEIYALFLPGADRLELTEVDAAIDGDVHFPPFDRSAFRETQRLPHPPDERHAHGFAFVTLERR